MDNNQSPRYNNQTITNTQFSNFKQVWLLIIGYWSLFGDCYLVIGD
jgi:hypothetical protein